MKRNPFPGRDEAGRGLCWGEKIILNALQLLKKIPTEISVGIF